ncbi:hypothetical protein [Nocardioides sp.]|uniref:hypothetical protein n=1 Tax=Nocardioides sp. TaxID=35761 RepID=UPI003515DBDD
MTQNATPSGATPTEATSTTSLSGSATSLDSTFEQRLAQRAALRHRHSQSLVRLMTERDDLRGVHALADLVDESIRWTA